MLKSIVKMFDKGNVCVVGLRGDGKDMLMGNVIARRKLPYVSNINYKAKKTTHMPFIPKLLDVGGNTYENFIQGNINPYTYPYGDGTDVYISDCGVYFPAQYCNELNKKYGYLATISAISRHLGFNMHFNIQNFLRCYDKLREMGDFFVYCNWCEVFFGKLVIQKVTIYDKMESCANRVPAFKSRLPIWAKKEMRNLAVIEKEKYRIEHGEIKTKLLLYINKTKYNTRVFKEMLEKNDTEVIKDEI